MTSKPKRNLPWGKLVAALVVAVALGGGGFFVWQLLSDKGGAATAEEAVTELVSAVADQDGIGALRLIAPGEIDGVDDVYSTVQKRLAKEGLLSSEDGLLLDALDISIKGLEVDVDQLGENAARVYLSDGELEVTLDPGKLDDRLTSVAARFPDGKTWTVSAEDAFEEFRIGGEERPFLTAVKLDGRWYVSAVATAGEYAIEELGLDAADYDVLAEEASESVASEDPEGAVDNVLDAIDSGDPAQLLAALPADQFVTVRPFVDTVRSWQDEYGAELSIEREGNLDTRFEGDGDLGRLTIRNANFSAAAYAEGDGGSGSLEISGDCLEADGDRECMDSTFRKVTGLDSFWVMLSKGDGGWQLDPVATVISYAKTVVDTIPESVALAAVGLPGLIEPSAQAQPNKSISVTTNDVGTAVVSVEVKKGEILAPSADEDDHYVSVFSPRDIDYPSDYGNAVLAEEAGTYRIMVESDDAREQKVDLQVDVLTPRAVSKPTNLKPFAGQGAGAYKVALNGRYSYPEEGNFDILDSKGEEVYLYSSEELKGTYTLIVYEELSLLKLASGFAGGGKSYRGTIGSSETVTTTVTLVEGAAAVISCTSSEDIRLEVGDLSVSADDNLSGTESLYVYPSYSGNFTLEIYNYGSSAPFSCTIG